MRTNSKSNHDKLDPNLPKRLSALRKKLNMTQRELAKEFYVTAGAIAHWETKVRNIPGPVKRLIELYEIASQQKKN